MEQDLVSVIVPVYNVEKYVRKCVESIINQSYRNIEIVIVDDGSTDNSLKICNEYSKTDKRIKVINKKMKGFLRQEIKVWRLLKASILLL